jgi:hypothetical protein
MWRDHVCRPEAARFKITTEVILNLTKARIHLG